MARNARKIQKTTNWPYQFCHFLVDKLGFTRVEREIDERGAETMEECGNRLNRLAKEVP